MTVNVSWGQVLQWLEKLAAYFGIGGVGLANIPNLPTPVRAVIAGVSAALVVVDRTTVAPTPTTPAKTPPT
jgi:hypothetical protein